MKDKIGIVQGRFHGFHLGHLEYILEAYELCEHLLIGINHYETIYNLPNSKYFNPTKASFRTNPFSYYDRYMMIKNSLIEYNIDPTTFDIIPFPIENLRLAFNYVDYNATFYLKIYDEWGEKKKRLLEGMGYRTSVMFRGNDANRKISGTQIRLLILDGKPWSHLVPKAVYKYITDNNIVVNNFREKTKHNQSKSDSLDYYWLYLAEKIALQAHKNQLDLNGLPYIEHPKFIVNKVESIEEKIVAWLHDVCEDSKISKDDLITYGFPKLIIDAIEAITRNVGEEYFDYIYRVQGNNLAKKIKVIDLNHNSDLTRIKKPNTRDIERVKKYQEALKLLT